MLCLQLMDSLLNHFEKLGEAAQREKKIEEVIEPSSTEEEEEAEEGGDPLVLRTPPQRLTLDYLTSSIQKVRATAEREYWLTG